MADVSMECDGLRHTGPKPIRADRLSTMDLGYGSYGQMHTHTNAHIHTDTHRQRVRQTDAHRHRHTHRESTDSSWMG